MAKRGKQNPASSRSRVPETAWAREDTTRSKTRLNEVLHSIRGESMVTAIAAKNDRFQFWWMGLSLRAKRRNLSGNGIVLREIASSQASPVPHNDSIATKWGQAPFVAI
jgi:hypothetical protein